MERAKARIICPWGVGEKLSCAARPFAARSIVVRRRTGISEVEGIECDIRG